MEIEVMGKKEEGKIFPKDLFGSNATIEEVDINGKFNIRKEGLLFDDTTKAFLGLSKARLSTKGDLIKIKVNGETHLCKKIYANCENLYSTLQKTTYFQDYETGKYFFVNNSEISGPYKSMRVLKKYQKGHPVKFICYEAIDENDMVHILDNVNIDFDATNNEYKYASKTAVVNETGKYAGIKDGKLTTDFVFDEPPVNGQTCFKSSEGFALTTDGNGKAYIYDTSNKKILLTVDNFGNEATSIDSVGDILILASEDKTVLINTRHLAIVYRNDKRFKLSLNRKDVLLSFDDKSVRYYLDNKTQEYKVTELPYAVISRPEMGPINGYLVATNDERKIGIITTNGRVVVDFDDYSYNSLKFENGYFFPLIKASGLEIYDMKLGKMITKVPLDSSIKVQRQDMDGIDLVDSRNGTKYMIYHTDDKEGRKIKTIIEEFGTEKSEESFNKDEGTVYKFFKNQRKI